MELQAPQHTAHLQGLQIVLPRVSHHQGLRRHQLPEENLHVGQPCGDLGRAGGGGWGLAEQLMWSVRVSWRRCTGGSPWRSASGRTAKYKAHPFQHLGRDA